MAERVFTQTFGVVAAVLEKDGKILLVKEASGDDKGKWNMPAGWIDVGQNPIDMATIEVKEETGLDFEPTGLIGVFSFIKTYPDNSDGKRLKHPIVLVFRGNILGGELIKQNEEIAETRWFSPDEINEMDSTKLRDMNIKQRIEDYFAGRNFPLDIIRHTVQE
ncbi:MAG: NUDIX domain-containing protein [bacterium]|nr:NUDIX domain-containing protein [bacterium]